MRAGGDEVHFAHRLVPLLDVLYREDRIRKRAEPRIRELRVGIGPVCAWTNGGISTTAPGANSVPAVTMRRSLKQR